MPRAYPVWVIDIRPGCAADAAAISRVRRASWFAAYEGILAAPVIDRATAAIRGPGELPPYVRTLVAVGGDDPAIVGYASFGPERAVASAQPPPAAPAGGRPDPDGLTPAGRAGDTGEVYAIYVTPAWWSAGAGRALMAAALSTLAGQRYRHAVLWVLAGNTRARRFYERAGFAADGGSNILAGLGNALEVRYHREL